MALVYTQDSRVFRPYSYRNEKEFEEAVVSLADQIFGPSTIYVDVKRRVSGNSIVTIPDGYVIDATKADEPELFVVENEIASHDPFKHIGIQMLRFATSFDDAQKDVRDFLMEAISADPKKLSRLEAFQAASRHRNIDA